VRRPGSAVAPRAGSVPMRQSGGSLRLPSFRHRRGTAGVGHGFPGSEDHDEVTFRPGRNIPQPVRYTTRDWWHVLKTWPASQLWRRIAPAVLSLTAWALLVTIMGKLVHPVCQFPLVPHGLVGTALGLLLVYRTNSANDRFWEGRKMWERVVSSSRDVAVLCTAHARHLGAHRLSRINRLISAFAVCLTEYVVGPGDTRHILPLWRIAPDDEGLIMASGSPPCRVAQLLLNETTRIPDSKDGLFSNRERSVLSGMVSELQKTVAQGERLVQTPIPQSYVRHTSRFLTLWLATLPFGLWHLIGWWTPAVVWAVSWALIGINDLGLGIEHPFDGPQSLRMFVMCNTVHAAVTDSLHAVATSRFAGLSRAFLERDVRGSGGAAEAAPEPVLVTPAALALARAAHRMQHGPGRTGHHSAGSHYYNAHGHGGSAVSRGSGPAGTSREVFGRDEILGRTALHHAAYSGDIQLVRRLIAAGAEVNAVDSWDGSTPVDVARARRHEGVERRLLNAGGVARVFEDTLRVMPYPAEGFPWQWTSAPALV